MIMIDMNKTELIDKIANKAQLEKTKVATIINSFLDVTSEALAKHDSVTLIGFGTLKVRKRKAKKGVNPQTGKTMTIPAKVVPAISFGEGLKKSVSKKKKLVKFATATPAKKKAAAAKPKAKKKAAPKKAAAKKTVVKKAAPKKKPAKKTAKKKK